jgi:hypothetical protein
MMNQEHKRPVTLEDLLRLKRAERPPTEFWSQFDHELRAKQLAALVEKRPWWRTLPNVFGGLSRYHLPLGATAILALTVLTVREYRSVAPGQILDTPNNVAASTPAAMTPPQEVAFIRNAASGTQEKTAAVAENDAGNDASNFVLASEATVPGQLSQMMLGAAPHSNASGQETTPAARFIAANLALVKASEPAIAQNLLGASRGFEARAIPARTPVVDPLSQMASPSDVRRSRLLNGAATAVSMNSPVPVRTTEFRSRRISDEQLYDTISRFDARGNSASFKF